MLLVWRGGLATKGWGSYYAPRGSGGRLELAYAT